MGLVVIKLDRMVIEEAGPNPDKVAAAIHDQIEQTRRPVPIAEIAYALDIIEIRYAPLTGLEGALVTPADRGEGAILVNSASRQRRQRYSIAHELGHFLNPWHRPLSLSAAFACTANDLTTGWRRPVDSTRRHLVQEAEANRFAIELLAPVRRLRPYLGGIPDLAKVIALAEELEISREAAARRYVELHANPSAVVFSRDGVVRYVDRADDFPFVQIQRGHRLPGLPT